ncbi:hypothetical protein [Paucibacter sp. B51]|uniref:hypothetical protein n=1 Tax=Paucibacter sp. B51 TaxID=2993315 RepID=UPI0022EBBA4A|nr:hypothetical protein [Paucibacter sp. B51]
MSGKLIHIPCYFDACNPGENMKRMNIGLRFFRPLLAIIICATNPDFATAQTELDGAGEAIKQAIREEYQPRAHLFMVAFCGAASSKLLSSSSSPLQQEKYRGFLSVYAGSKIIDKVSTQFPILKGGPMREALEPSAGKSFHREFSSASKVMADWDNAKLTNVIGQLRCSELLADVNTFMQARFPGTTSQ